MKRNEGLAMKKAENVSVPRAMYMNKDHIAKWFNDYKKFVTKPGVKV